MLLRIRSGVADTRDHWANRTRWAGGRRQLTLHLIFDDSTLADATTGMREALVPLAALDVVPPQWLHVTLTPLGFTDEIDQDAAAAVADEVFEQAGRLSFGRLRFDTVVVGRGAVTMPASDAGWLHELVELQWDAVDRHLGERDWDGFSPHTSLAYANATIPVSQVTEALADATAAASSFSVQPTLALLELFIDDHVYRWRELRRA